jgi:alanyl-tRNA synthetase
LDLDSIASGVEQTKLVYLREMQKCLDEANIMKVVPEKSTHAYLILDQTIFHPKGGGQPSDKGVIRSSEFEIDVKKAIYHQGKVIHWGKLIRGAPKTGTVTCEIDWPFRYLVMRRHTAAHLLDHCLAYVTSSYVETTDSWLDEPCYVGYAGDAPDQETLQKVQEVANRMIASGGKVEINFLTPSQGAALLQHAPNFERLPSLDEIRTVTIAGCDPIPCGGTHVTDIAEIRKVSITRAEPMLNCAFRLHFSLQA